jgi:hypothetical protein
MNRPYLEKSAKQLLEIAYSPSCSEKILKDIVHELSIRNSDNAFQAYIEVGKLLEQAQEEELKHRKEKERQHASGQYMLQRNQEGFFEWPSTNAPASKFGFKGDIFFYKDGLLSYVGYRVGYDGVRKHIRRRILDCVFHNFLPRVVSFEYMDEWGSPKTAARLHKLADTLAAFTRNAKRRKTADLSIAISDWESDLKYLFQKY